MALVAYSDDSDLGTDSEDEETLDGGGGQKISPKVKVTPAAEAEPGLSVAPPSKPSGVDTIEDEDEDEDYTRGSVPSSGLFSSVPAPVPVASLLPAGEEAEDELVDVPTVDTWKVTQELKRQQNSDGAGVLTTMQEAQPTSAKKKAKKVKILIPSLSEFADDEEDEEVKEPPRKKVNPSRSGSGLFSVLPEPKHASTKEAGRSLLPHILTKRPTQTQKPQKKVTKKPPAAPGGAAHVSDEEEEEATTGTSDFFSLSEESTVHPATVVPEVATTHVSAAIAPSLEPLREESRVPRAHPEGPSPSMVQHQHYEDVDPSTMVQEPPQPAAAAAAAAGIDEAAIMRLAGKRGRADVINFIDVNADDALLTKQEWMTKALSEEKPQHGFSRKREGLPTQKQKQKHQITYLAHQAKERELDLKNTWALNRMTKMQSQAKYGF